MSASYRANLQRAEFLREQRRFAEAETYLQQAIGEQPDNSLGYYQLAFCYCNWSGHSSQALTTIDRAISIDPERAEFFALRAWILGNLEKTKDALTVADQALELDPTNLLALNALTRSQLALHDWKKADVQARRTLELHPTNELAASFLAVALLQQGKLKESAAITTTLLSRTPHNPMAQRNAGWTALQAGDHRRANLHFLEALRLDPKDDNARNGLLHSFNSRVWIYRIYFQFISWLGKHRKEMRYFYLGIIFSVYWLVVTTLQREFGREGIYWVLVIIAIYMMFIGFGRSFANLFLLLDPFARYSLTRKEKLWSLLAGSIYGVFLVILATSHAWLQASILLTILLFFLWSVLYPRFQAFLTGSATP